MLNIVSFNIRCQPYIDGINAFIHRAGYVADKILTEKPDVICFQEIVPYELDVLEKLLPNYAFYGQYNGKLDEQEGLFTAVKKDRFELAGLETVWLSPTPYVYGSRFEDASPYPRLCVMVYLREKETLKEFRVYNTHLDHRSEQARNKGLNIILEFIEDQQKKKFLPSLFMGDFNAQKDSETIKMCDRFINLTEDLGDTFHDFGKKTGYGQIDYIFATDGVEKIKVERWQDCHDGIYLTDHYPVSVQLELK